MSHQDPSQSTPETQERFVSIKEFARRSSLARSSIYRMVDRGEISKPRKLTPKRVGWPSTEVEAWFSARAASA